MKRILVPAIAVLSLCFAACEGDRDERPQRYPGGGFQSTTEVEETTRVEPVETEVVKTEEPAPTPDVQAPPTQPKPQVQVGPDSPYGSLVPGKPDHYFCPHCRYDVFNRDPFGKPFPPDSKIGCPNCKQAFRVPLR